MASAGRSRLLAVTLAVSLAALAGCSEKQEASTTLPSSSARAPAPTTEALPPVGPADFPVPAEARTKDAAGAEAFLRYWIELIDHQRAIPAGQPLRELGPECHECLRIAQNYDEAAQDGNRYVGGDLTLNDFTEPVERDGEMVIVFGARQESVSLVDRNGSLVEQGPKGEQNLGSGIRLRWDEDDRTWLVTGFNVG